MWIFIDQGQVEFHRPLFTVGMHIILKEKSRQVGLATQSQPG
jgi:hypothetical protein